MELRDTSGQISVLKIFFLACWAFLLFLVVKRSSYVFSFAVQQVKMWAYDVLVEGYDIEVGKLYVWKAICSSDFCINYCFKSSANF